MSWKSYFMSSTSAPTCNHYDYEPLFMEMVRACRCQMQQDQQTAAPVTAMTEPRLRASCPPIEMRKDNYQLMRTLPRKRAKMMLSVDLAWTAVEFSRRTWICPWFEKEVTHRSSVFNSLHVFIDGCAPWASRKSQIIRLRRTLRQLANAQQNLALVNESCLRCRQDLNVMDPVYNTVCSNWNQVYSIG